MTCFPAGMEGFELCLSSLNPSEDCSAQVCIWQPEFRSMFECIYSVWKEEGMGIYNSLDNSEVYTVNTTL